MEVLSGTAEVTHAALVCAAIAHGCYSAVDKLQRRCGSMPRIKGRIMRVIKKRQGPSFRLREDLQAFSLFIPLVWLNGLSEWRGLYPEFVELILRTLMSQYLPLVR